MHDEGGGQRFQQWKLTIEVDDCCGSDEQLLCPGLLPWLFLWRRNTIMCYRI